MAHTLTPQLDDAVDRTSAPDARRWWTLTVLCLSLLLIVASNTSLVVALPSIQRGLGAGPSSLQWIMDSYSLVFAALLLPTGACRRTN